MEPIIAVVLALGALMMGALLGWLLAGRQAAPLKAECDELRARCVEAEKSQAVAETRAGDAEQVRFLLDGVTKERDEALQELAGLRAGAKEREEAYRQQLEQMKQSFSQLATEALNEAQAGFLKRASDRFDEAGKESETKLKALLQPVETTLKRYEEGLNKVEKERVGSYESLMQTIAQLSQGNEIVRRETQRLANVMGSSPKARGRWGEEQLRTILESAGLAENVDFTLQSAVSDGERQLRPDCVINLPGDRCIVVDVKCPLVAFELAYDEEDEGRRAELLRQHAKAMGTYAADLGKKSYWRQFDLSPDFVIMFIPGEHFLSAAAERAPKLIENAFREGVIIASTINMLALAKIMAGMWRQEAIAAQANEIHEVGKELYRRLSVMGGHVSRLGKNLQQATGAYDDFVGSLERNVLTQAKRFEDLKVETSGKSIESPRTIGFTAQPLTKLVEIAEAEGPPELAISPASAP